MIGTVVVAGALAQKPGHGGHAWVFLQYLLGFKRLGWDVLFVDQLEPAMSLDASGQPCPLDRSENLRYFRNVMARFDLDGAFALLYDHGREVIGLSRQQVLERTKRAACLLNVVGFLSDEEILGSAQRRVFLDIDPGFGQMWQALGLHDAFRGHDAFVTVGERVGQPACPVPACGLDWIPTRPPVVRDRWPAQAEATGEDFTSIASWRGAYGPVEYQGKTYGLRVHEFRQLAPLPRLSGQRFRLALDIHPAEVKDLALLRENGWTLEDPRRVAGDPDAYQRFIQGSRAEFMVAKNMYVQAQSGWFSDRSACYLASGRPVLAQDTGITSIYPTGEGLLTYTTLDEALAGVEAIERDYARHARAARAVAEAYFDSDKVLGRLLSRLGVT